MKRVVDWNEWIRNQEISNIEEKQSSLELLSWRKQSSPSFTARYYSENQNAIDHHSQNKDISSSNQKENQQLLNITSPSTNITTDNSIESQINTTNKSESNKESIPQSFLLLIHTEMDSYLSPKCVTITRCISKPTRHEPIQTATSQTRQRQRDRYINYRNRLTENQLYSLIVASNGVQCCDTDCQPSVFNASYQCRTISSEKDTDILKQSTLMNDQDIKQNISYISLTNLSNIIDREPNVSRRDSYSRSTSNILTHKTSLFLTEIFNKMTHAQRAKSIAKLVELHETLIKSNTTIDKLQRTASLPNLNNKTTKLHSVTSLSSEKLTANIVQIENKPSSTSSTKQNPIAKNINSEHINLEAPKDKHTIDLKTELHDKQTISSPVKLLSIHALDATPKRKIFEENMPTIHIDDPSMTASVVSSPTVYPPITKPSPVPSKSSNTTAYIEKGKIDRSKHILEADLDEQSSTSKFKSFKISETEQIKAQSSNLINSKTIAPSSNSIMNSIPLKEQQSNNGINSETDLENNNDLFTKSNVIQNLQKSYSKNDPSKSLKTSSLSNKSIDHTSQSKVVSPSVLIKEKQMPLSSSHFQSSNDENRIENNLKNAANKLSQQDIISPNTNFDRSSDILFKESNKTKQVPSSHPPLKNSLLLITSPTISTDKETSTKPELTSLSSMDDGNTPMMTRTTTASTNLTIIKDNDDDDEEQLKRNSLGLARDSLELLRNATPQQDSNNKQLISHIYNDSTPHKRKSVLKSCLDSSDNIPTPELISYIAIDEVKGDESLMEEQVRRRSLTIGGGTIISCTSPKPKRDSLILLQERYSGSTNPHTKCYHLSSSDSKHVEFIREPGDTITPVLHIGRGIISKYLSTKSISPTTSNDHFHRTIDLSERSKSEMSVTDNQQQFENETRPRRSSLDSVSRHGTPQTQLTAITPSLINKDEIEEEKVCFNKSDYDEMIDLLLTPLTKTKKELPPVKSTFKSNIELCINNRLTTFLHLILLILLIFFYIFIFIKSQYWQ